MRGDPFEGINANDKASMEWLRTLEPNTLLSYKTHWRYFLAFTGMNGDQILADRYADLEAKRYQWENKIIEFKRFEMEKKGLSSSTAKAGANAVRGFFSFHRVEIKLRPQQSRKIKESAVQHPKYRFTREELHVMADIGNLKEKYVIVAGKSLGLRISDFRVLTRASFEPHINKEPPVCIGPLNTVKENVPAYPFLDSDALPIVKQMLAKMDREGRTAPHDKLITFKRKDTASDIVKRLAHEVGINQGNYSIRFHCLRAFTIDTLSRFMSESKWKQVVGKVIDEGAYVSPDSLREDFKRAMPELTFRELHEKEKDKFETLMTMAAGLGISREQVAQYFTQQRAVTLPAQIIVLEKVIESKGFGERGKISDRFSKEVVKGNCPDGQRCQRVVTEEQLEPMLLQGWHVVTCLPSGKIVVSNENTK